MTKQTIKRKLKALHPATIPGQSNDGDEIRVTLAFTMNPPTQQQLEQSALAADTGLDLQTFTGHLDRVWVSKKNKQLCFTVLAKERIDLEKRHYCYRTFNVDSGQVLTLEKIG